MMEICNGRCTVDAGCPPPQLIQSAAVSKDKRHFYVPSFIFLYLVYLYVSVSIVTRLADRRTDGSELSLARRLPLSVVLQVWLSVETVKASLAFVSCTAGVAECGDSEGVTCLCQLYCWCV